MTRQRRADHDEDLGARLVEHAPEAEQAGGADAVVARLMSQQQGAGYQAVGRMLRSRGAHHGMENAGLWQVAMQGVSPTLNGLLADDEGGAGLQDAGGGIAIGAADAEASEPGVAWHEADEAIAVVEAPLAAQAAPADESSDAAAPADAAPAPAAGPDAAAPAVPDTAAPGPAPDAGAPGGGAAPAAPTALTLTSRTDMRAPDGTPDDRTTIGMGEVVYFSVGGALVDWTASAGFPQRRSGRATFAWELPTPGSATITATDPATGATASIAMTVIAPSTLRMHKLREQAVTPAGADMIQSPRFGLRSVSFGNVEWLEVAGGPSAVSPYFAALQTAGADLNHHPNPDFLRIGPRLTDEAGIRGLPAPFGTGGSFHWEIPNRFRRAGTTGTGEVFVNSVQSFRITAAGVVTVRKQGASVTAP